MNKRRNRGSKNDGPFHNPDELGFGELKVVAAEVYSRLGYRKVQYSGKSSSTDRGVDVWMMNRKGEVEIVQCKQLSSTVDRSELVKFAKTMRQQHAIKGHFWAPGQFTQPAIDFAAEQNIELYENEKILELTNRAFGEREAPDSASARPRSGIAQHVQSALGSVARRMGLTRAQVIILIGIVLVGIGMLASLGCFVFAGIR